jgi:Fic family protein
MYNTIYIDKINKLKNELDKKVFKKEDEKRLKKKFRLEFNYNSNHLEGNTLTYGQTQLLLMFDKSSGDASVSDIEEMKAHDVALSLVEEMAADDERPLSETFIKELNELILVKPFWKEAISTDGTPTRKQIIIGQYKSTPNSVRLRNGELHEYASVEATPGFMSDLLRWYREQKDVMHPVQLAAEFHYKFVCIHPFDDGNGRVARLIMNYILLKNNYPLVVIKSVDKENYLTALQKADTGDKNAIIKYIEKQSVWSLELCMKAANNEDIEEAEDLDKEIEILKREKLTKNKIHKTPKVCYDLFHHVQNDVWGAINNVLSKFDDFFTETSKENHVDNHKIKKTKTVHAMPLSRFMDKEEVVKKYDVFGCDLAEEEIKVIRWTKKMLSLKSGTKKTDFEVSMSLHFNESTYLLMVRESNNSHSTFKETELLTIENEYKSYFMTDAIQAMVKTISKHLISQISTNE